MWISKKKLEQLISGGESVFEMKRRIQKLKDELAELETQKKMDEREIEHLVKLKEEKLDIEHKKKELELKNKFKDLEMKLQTQYHDQILGALNNAKAEMLEVYKEILKRLPDVSVMLGNAGKKKE